MMCMPHTVTYSMILSIANACNIILPIGSKHDCSMGNCIAGIETATLSSTPPYYEGNSITTCPSSNVILTCMVTQRPILRWEAVPGLSEHTFTPDDIDNDRDSVVHGPYTLTLVDVAHRTQSVGGLADLTSTLEVMVDDIDDGTNITCKGTTDEEYVVISKRGT